MKSKAFRTAVIAAVLIIASCNEPKTTVTNVVHPDGSVTRYIEMRSSENKFNTSGIQVPFDKSWTIRDSMEISSKGDTTWVKRAVKHFGTIDEINRDYETDSSSNRSSVRSASFEKKFMWFNTWYRFSERIEKVMQSGYPISDYLSTEEISHFFAPESVKEERRKSADSISVKVLEDSIDMRTERWLFSSLVSEWIDEFSRLTKGSADSAIGFERLKSREDDLVRIIRKYDSKFDSLWEKGVVLEDMIGERYAARYKTEADTAISHTLDKLFISFSDYTVRSRMPGRVTDTNGYPDSTGLVIWPVVSDFFMTEPYIMWVESKDTNAWAWIVTFIFLAFISAGLLFRRRG